MEERHRDILWNKGIEMMRNRTWEDDDEDEPEPVDTPIEELWHRALHRLREMAINLGLLTGLVVAMMHAPTFRIPGLLWLVASGCAKLLSRRGVNWQGFIET